MSWKNVSKFRNATLKAEKREDYFPCNVPNENNSIPIATGHSRFATSSGNGIFLYSYEDNKRDSTTISSGVAVDLAFSPFIRPNGDEILVSAGDNTIKVCI
jgi:hypothetical protein